MGNKLLDWKLDAPVLKPIVTDRWVALFEPRILVVRYAIALQQICKF